MTEAQEICKLLQYVDWEEASSTLLQNYKLRLEYEQNKAHGGESHYYEKTRNSWDHPSWGYIRWLEDKIINSSSEDNETEEQK